MPNPKLWGPRFARGVDVKSVIGSSRTLEAQPRAGKIGRVFFQRRRRSALLARMD